MLTLDLIPQSVRAIFDVARRRFYLTVTWTPSCASHAIEAHKIYAGLSSGSYSEIIRVPWSGEARAVIDLPSIGPWFVVVTTIPKRMRESYFSHEVSRLANVRAD